MKPDERITSIMVPLNPTDADKERYRARDQNYVQVALQDATGKVISDVTMRVILTMSRDAMFAFGSALVRASCDAEVTKGCWELSPARKEEAIESLGVYVHPVSCQMIVNLCSTGTLEDALKQGG